VKKIAIAVLFCLLFPTTFTLAANAADASIDAEVAVFHALQETGWEDNYVALQDDGQLLIRYDAVVISSDLIDHMLGIAVTAYETVKTYTPDQAVQEIAVEAYFNDEAICSATVAYADLQAYASGSINESALVDRTAFQDIRSLDTLLKYDLALFSVIVNDIEIGKDTAKILLEFAGDSEETFWKDYSAMVLWSWRTAPG
jgi:hypothetical protein